MLSSTWAAAEALSRPKPSSAVLPRRIFLITFTLRVEIVAAAGAFDAGDRRPRTPLRPVWTFARFPKIGKYEDGNATMFGISVANAQQNRKNKTSIYQIKKVYVALLTRFFENKSYPLYVN